MRESFSRRTCNCCGKIKEESLDKPASDCFEGWIIVKIRREIIDFCQRDCVREHFCEELANENS